MRRPSLRILLLATLPILADITPPLGIGEERPPDAVAFDADDWRLIVRCVEAPGRGPVVLAVDPVSGVGVGGVELSLVDEQPREGGAPVSIPLGTTDERGVCIVGPTESPVLQRPAIEGHRAGTRRRRTLVDQNGIELASCRWMATPRGERAVDDADLLAVQPLAFVTTDRPRYRPGEEVRFKAVLRDASGASIAPGEAPARVEIRDGEGRLRHVHQGRWSPFGSVSGRWRTDGDAILGEYTVSVVMPTSSRRPPLGGALRWADRLDVPWRQGAFGRFTMTADGRPELGVRIVAGEEPSSATISVVPLGGGTPVAAAVQWRVFLVGAPMTRRDVSFQSREPLAPLDDPRAWYYQAWIARAERERAALPERSGVQNCLRFGDADAGTGAVLVAEGSGRTGPDGTLPVSWKVPDDPREHGPVVRIVATVRDAAHLVAEGLAEFSSDPVPLRLEVGTDRLFAEPEEEIEVRLRASTPDGRPVEGQAIELEGFLLRPSDEAVAGRRSRWGADRVRFHHESLHTDVRGRARTAARVPAGGRVRWRASAVPRGRPPGEMVVARADHWSAGDDVVLAWSGAAEEAAFDWDRTSAPPLLTESPGHVRITPDRFAYAAGERVRLLVRSRVAPWRGFVGVETRTSRRVEPVEIDGAVEVIEVPLTEEDSGLATIWVAGARGEATASDERTVCVFPAKRLLEVDVRPRGPGHRPGGSATIDVAIRGHDGEGRRAEVEIGVDPHDADVIDHPLVVLHPMQSWPGGFVHDGPGRLERRHWMTFPTEPGRIDRMAGRPFTGAGAEATSMFPMSPGPRTPLGWMMPGPSRRKGFQGEAETEGPVPDATAAAPWMAHVVTGDDGRATVALDLPDAPGRYRVVARAVTRAGEAGLGEATLPLRVPAQVRIVAPRWLTVGDRTTFSTVLHTDLARPAEFTARVRADGVTIGERVVRMEAEDRKCLEWPLEIGGGGSIRIEAELVSTDASAATVLTVPVRDLACDVRVRAGRTSVEIPESLAERPWTLDVTAEPESLARVRDRLWAMADDLRHSADRGLQPWLDVDDYRAATSILGGSRALGLPDDLFAGDVLAAVDRGTLLAHRSQSPDGGWTRAPGEPSSAATTTVVLESLLDARDAGFWVDAGAVGRATAFLASAADDERALAVRVRAGDERAAEAIANLSTDRIVALLDGDTRPEAARVESGWTTEREATPVERLALVALAGRGDLVPVLPGAPPGEGEARTVGSVREAALVIRAIATRDTEDRRLPGLVAWAMEEGKKERPLGSPVDAALLARAMAAVPVTKRPGAWSLTLREGDQSVHGIETLEGEGSMVVTPKAMNGGRNHLHFHSNDPTFRLSLTARCRIPEPPEIGESALRLGRGVEKFVGIADGGKEAWHRVRSGESVRLGDRLRVVLTSGPYGGVAEAPLAAGLEPVSAAPSVRERNGWDGRFVVCGDRLIGSMPFGEREGVAVEVRPTRPGRYRFPPTVTRHRGRTDVTGTFVLCIEE